MVNARYHVWEYADARRRSMRMVTKKAMARHDPVEVPAVWQTKQAANKWAGIHCPNGARVFQCDCTKGTGMGDHGDE